ncbi:MAG: SUMF1/EgtB/PvdO family nonheme iron enzyme, partial [Planctomycetota bacterium]
SPSRPLRAMPRRSWPSLRLLVVGALMLATGCGEEPSEPESLLTCELLAFVPRGSSMPFPSVRCDCPEDLLVDRFEVTRGLWLEIASRSDSLPDLDGRVGQDWTEPTSLLLPAVGMDHAEASTFAALRGMRLPTVGEWMYVAGGSRAQTWPHGNSPETSVANTAGVRLRAAAPVGTFPNGQSTGTHVHDLIGNVWEWTTPPLPRGMVPASWLGVGGEDPHPLWAMGGSYLHPARALHGEGGVGAVRYFNAQGLQHAHRAADLGLRCVAPARAFLVAHAREWSAPSLRPRVLAVGRLWGSRSVALLEVLAGREGAPAALDWLLQGARQ